MFWKKWKKKTEADEFMDASSIKSLYGSGIRGHTILWAAAVLVVVAVFWTAFAEIDEVTSGAGKVIPSSKIQIIQHLEGGVVEKILVQEGQKVTKNQVLMEVDDIRYTALFREGLLRAAALQAKIARLVAEAKLTEFTIDPEIEKKYPNLVNNERDLYEANKKELAARMETLGRQVSQKQQELAIGQAKTTKLKRSHALVGQELKMTKSLLKEGAASQVEVLRLERQVNEQIYSTVIDLNDLFNRDDAMKNFIISCMMHNFQKPEEPIIE